MKKIKIHTLYITLGQLLKLSDCIDSGGQAKLFLAENVIRVNDEIDQRRGRKLYSGDRIEVDGKGTFIIE